MRNGKSAFDKNLPQGELVKQLKQELESRFGIGQTVTVGMAPGRVNIIGDHTDYNDGFVLPMTINRAVYVAMRPTTGQRVRLYSVNFDTLHQYEQGALGSLDPSHWTSYVVGVIEECRRADFVGSGLDVVVYGDVPLGAGLSSSAALEVSTALALESAFAFELGAVRTALLCQRVEHTYAGVQCGIMDQFASRLGQKDRALLLDCRDLTYRRVPLLHTMVIVDSRASRALAGSEYNTRRKECEQVVQRLKPIDPSVSSLRDVSFELFEQHGHVLSVTGRKRCRHILTENRRVLESADAMDRGDSVRLGELMTASHRSLRDDYEVSSRPLDVLVEAALEVEGVYGARLTGAGFGGCTVNLMESDAVGEFKRYITGRYIKTFNKEPSCIVVDQNLEAVKLL